MTIQVVLKMKVILRINVFIYKAKKSVRICLIPINILIYLYFFRQQLVNKNIKKK